MKNVIINYAPVIILCQLSSYDNTVLQLWPKKTDCSYSSYIAYSTKINWNLTIIQFKNYIFSSKRRRNIEMINDQVTKMWTHAISRKNRNYKNLMILSYETLWIHYARSFNYLENIVFYRRLFFDSNNKRLLHGGLTLKPTQMLHV